MIKTHSPLVGMHFRPPANALLSALPMGAELLLRREPENEWDHFAIRVYCRASSIPKRAYADLETSLQGFGFDLKDILSQAEHQLGYIASKPPKGYAQGLAYAPSLAPEMDKCETVPKARLVFDPRGKPLVEIDW